MALTAEQKKTILAEYGLHETDTGSPDTKVVLGSKPFPPGVASLSINRALRPLPLTSGEGRSVIS